MKLSISNFIFFTFFSYQVNGFCSSDVQECVDSAMEFWKDQPIVELGDDRYIRSQSWQYYKHRSIDGIPIKENNSIKSLVSRVESRAWMRCKKKN